MVWMFQVKILYVRGLSAATTEYDIRAMFESVTEEGCISRVKKVKNFAFVHFKDRKNAEKALNSWNGKELHGSELEVTWSKPADKLQKFPSMRRKQAECAKEMSSYQSNSRKLATSSCKDPVGITQQSLALPSSAPSYEQVLKDYPLSHVNYHNVSSSPLPLKQGPMTSVVDTVYSQVSQFLNYPQSKVVENGAPLSVVAAAQSSDVMTFSPGGIIPYTPLQSPSNFYFPWFSQSEQRQDKRYHNSLPEYEMNNNIYMPTYQFF